VTRSRKRRRSPTPPFFEDRQLRPLALTGAGPAAAPAAATLAKYLWEARRALAAHDI